MGDFFYPTGNRCVAGVKGYESEMQERGSAFGESVLKGLYYSPLHPKQLRHNLRAISRNSGP